MKFKEEDYTAFAEYLVNVAKEHESFHPYIGVEDVVDENSKITIDGNISIASLKELIRRIETKLKNERLSDLGFVDEEDL